VVTLICAMTCPLNRASNKKLQSRLMVFMIASVAIN
jgi:hypothetical protein